MIKLVFALLAVVLASVLVVYFYERAKELRLAEERAKAVGGRALEVRPPDALAGETPPTE